MPGRIAALVALIVLIVVLIFVTGWADDRAKPGTQGRGNVSTASP